MTPEESHKHRVNRPAVRELVVSEDVWPEVQARMEAIGLTTVYATRDIYGVVVNRRPQEPDMAEIKRKGLSEREYQVLSGMRDGLSNRAIGTRLFLSEDTIKTHARRLYRKLGVPDRAAAVAEAYERGIFTVGSRHG